MSVHDLLPRWLQRRRPSLNDPGITSVPCSRCGAEITEWFSIIWEHCRGLPDDEIQPIQSHELRCWCVPCSDEVKAHVRDAIWGTDDNDD